MGLKVCLCKYYLNHVGYKGWRGGVLRRGVCLYYLNHVGYKEHLEVTDLGGP